MILPWIPLAAEIVRIDANSSAEYSPRRLGQKPKAAHHCVIQIMRTCYLSAILTLGGEVASLLDEAICPGR